MPAILRKLAAIASALGASVRAWARELRARMRLGRSRDGFRIELGVHPDPIVPRCCCACGAPGVESVAPARSLRALIGRPPAVRVALCESCSAVIRKHGRFELVVAATGGSAAALVCGLVFLIAPWSRWAPMLFFALGACALALGLRLLRPVVIAGSSGFKGVPARWLARTRTRWHLATPSAELRDAVLAAIPEAASRPARVTERDGRPLLLAAVLTLPLSAWLWRALHPELRIVNLGARAVHVLVDARPVAQLPPTWSEAPNIGIRTRVPLGSRAFEARDDSGVRVDFVRGWVGLQNPALYAPAHQPFCLWIEQRAYGAIAPDGPGVLRLPAEASFYRLPFEPDAWFQPNPAAQSRDRWFSGGTRRAVRFGPCSSPALP